MEVVMKSLRPLSIVLALVGLAGGQSIAQEAGWNGTWSGLWEQKTQAEFTIQGNAVEYRMQGLERPVSDVKIEGPIVTFTVGLNSDKSTIILRRTEVGAEGAFLSPGGTRHDGRFVNLTPLPLKNSIVDSTPTSGIAPAAEDLKKR
jgi:hypothetical protein